MINMEVYVLEGKGMRPQELTQGHMIQLFYC